MSGDSAAEAAIQGPHVSLVNAATAVAGTHQIILQTLNRWRVHDGKKVWYDLKNFEGTEEGWDAVPVIYAQPHPKDFDAFDEDPEAGLAELPTYEGTPGRVVGFLTNTELLRPGQPRLQAEINFTDPEIETKYLDGLLAPSTGFRVRRIDSAGKMQGSVKPHHLLLFVQDEKNQPRDQGAMLLNKEEQEEQSVEMVNAGRELSAKNKSKLQGFRDAITKAIDGLAEMLATPDGGQATGEVTATNAIQTGMTTITTEGSYEEQHQEIADALMRTVNPIFPDGSAGWINILATFPDTVIYEPYCGVGTHETFQIPYTLGTDGVTFGTPTKVEQAFIEATNQETTMEKSEYERHLALVNKSVTDKDAELANKATELANKDVELANLRDKIAKIEQTAKDKEWAAVKNSLAPGEVDTPEKEAAIRNKIENHPYEWSLQILNQKRPAPTKEEGVEFSNKGGAGDYLKDKEDWDKAAGGI